MICKSYICAFFLAIVPLLRGSSIKACGKKLESIEIFVQDVPKYYTPLSDDIYMAGSFNDWAWNDPIYKMKRLSHNTFQIRLQLERGTYEYKFTRGSQNTSETKLDGSALDQNRQLIVTCKLFKPKTTVRIQNWQDMLGNHTANGHVHIVDAKFPYPQFNDTKQITIYLPPDYYTNTKQSYPVIYLHDGQHLFDSFLNGEQDQDFDQTMEDFYYSTAKTRPKRMSILVGIPNKPYCTDELTPYTDNDFPSGFFPSAGGKGDLYMTFLVNDLKPYIDKNFRTLPHRNYTGILGASFGGLISFYAGIKYQHVFSRIGAFSAPYYWNETIFTLTE